MGVLQSCYLAACIVDRNTACRAGVEYMCTESHASRQAGTMVGVGFHYEKSWRNWTQKDFLFVVCPSFQ